jgi:tRNA-2-methylthio-N6-dimethylallyladenosine synthase
VANKKLYIKTYGCQMNFYDSDKMSDVLKPVGYEPTDTPESADMVIINTCHIREKASEKMYSDLGRMRKVKNKRADGDDMIIAIAGCVGQAEGEEIFKRAPYVDIVVGPQSYHRLPDMVAGIARDSGSVAALDFDSVSKFDALPEEAKTSGPSAFLTIQEGCDKFCTFCVVPYTRGAEFSRTVPEIYREAVRLVEGGAKEVSLLGQNVNAFHGAGPEGEEWNLGKLIKHLANIRGLERINYSTSHPRDMHEELYEAHRDVEMLVPYLHLPVQSGSDRILELMNRKHKAADYLKIIERLRKARPEMMFSSDFIVGFPGETKQDFKDTMKLVEDVEFSQAYSFAYSERPGTPAAAQEDQLSHEEKFERLYELQAVLRTQQNDSLHSQLGKRQQVLLEKKGRYDGQCVGKNQFMQSAHVNGVEGMEGQIVEVLVTEVHKNSLTCELLANVPAKKQAVN